MPEDSLKALFRSLPEIEPSGDLRGRILAQVSQREEISSLWALKPALAFASFILIALLGVWLAAGVLPAPDATQKGSAILQWAEGSPAVTLSQGGFSL